MDLSQTFRLTPADAEATTYLAVNLLSVCSRALEVEGVPENDCTRFDIAQTIGVAIEKLHAVIDTLEAAHVRKGPSPVEGSPAELYDQWKEIHDSLKARMEAAGDNPETPEFLALLEREEALGQRIATANPRTDADAAAMLEWTFDDSDGQVWCDLYVQAQQAVAKYLTGQS